MADTFNKNELYNYAQTNFKKLLEVALSTEVNAEEPLDDPEILQKIQEISIAMNEPLGSSYMAHQLLRDCSEGKYEQVKDYIANCDDINELGPEGETALTCAINANNYPIVELLLKSGANSNSRSDKTETTPLMDAANLGSVDIVHVLLEFGANPDITSPTNNTAVHYTACGGHVECCKLMMDYSRNPQQLLEEQNENGHTALMEAATNGFLEITKFLVQSGAQINTPSAEFKETALTLASYKGYSDIVQFLLEAGADHEHRTDEMHTALMEASMEGHIEAAKVLLYYGAHVTMRTDSFESPLTLAACSGHSDVVAWLIKYGADIEEVNDESYTPLMEASREGHLETVAMLLSLGANINRVTEETQETAMTLAACGGFYDIVLLLHGCGADIELGASTPLMEAAQEGHLEIVKTLLALNAKVDACNSSQETSLHLAAENGHLDVCRYLLDHNADIGHMSEGGRTCLMKASRAGNLEVMILLIDRGSQIDQMTSLADHNALSLACANGHCKVVEYLLQIGADPTVKLKDNCSVLIEASRAGHIDVIEILLRDYKRDRRLLATADPIDGSIDPNIGTLEQLNNHCISATTKSTLDITRQLSSNTIGNCFPLVNNNTKHNLLSSNQLSTLMNDSQQMSVARSLLSPTEIPHPPSSLYPFHTIDDPLNPIGPQSSFPDVVSLPISIFGTDNDRPLANVLDTNSPNFDDWVKYMCPNVFVANSSSLPSSSSSLLLLNQSQTELSSTMMQQATATTSSAHRIIKKAKHSDSFSSQFDQHRVPRNLFAEQPIAIESEYSANYKFHSCETEIPFDLGVDVKSVLTTPPSNRLINENNDCESLPSNDDRDCNKCHLTSPPKDGLKNAFIYPTPKNWFSTNKQLSTSTTSSTDSGIFSLDKTVNVSTPIDLTLEIFGSITPISISPIKSNICNHVTSTPFPKQVLQPKRRLQPNQRTSLSNTSVFLNSEHEIKSNSCLLPSETTNKYTNLNFNPERNLSNENRDLIFQQSVLGEDECQLSGLLKLKSGIMANDNGNSMENLKVVKEIENEENENEANYGSDLEMDNFAPPYHQNNRMMLNNCCNKTDCKRKLNVNVCTESLNESPLSLACYGGHIEVVKLLINSGAKLEHRDKKSQTALHVGVLNGHVEVVRFLLESGADIETMVDRTKDTALSIACANGKLEIVDILIRKGANIEHRNISDYTPLSLAASGGYVDIIKLLLSKNAEINSRTNSKLGISPLMLAAMNGYMDAVTILLDHGSDINAQIETNRNTALTLACYQGRTEIVSLLIDKKACIEHRAKSGLTPLMEAASQGHVKVGNILIAAGADVNAPPVPTSRETALIIAAEKGHTDFVRLLLQHNAAIDARNKKGDTPLWLASNGGFIDVVKLLINSVPDQNCADSRRMTCLMAAFKKGHVKVVKELVKFATQFPSEHDCVKHIRSIKTDDKDLIKRCESCKEIIVKAKERQECEAAKNAKDLLKQVEEEKKAKEHKEVKQAKKREKKKAKKKAKHEEKDVDVDKSVAENPEEEFVTPEPDPPTVTYCQEHSTDLRSPRNNENINPDIVLPVKSNKRSRTRQESENNKNHTIEDNKSRNTATGNSSKKVSTPVIAPDPVTISKSTLKTSNDSDGLINNKTGTKNNSWTPINSNKIISVNKPEEITVSSNWQKIGGNKKRLDLQVNKKDIGKVIGQGGSVVNAIRHITGAHIDIDSMANDLDERTVHLKGTLEAVTKAKEYICDLVDGNITGNIVIKESEPYLAKTITSPGIDVEYPKPVHTKMLPIVRQNGKLNKFGYSKFGVSSPAMATSNLQYGFTKSNKCADFASVAAAGIVNISSPRVKYSEKTHDNFPSQSDHNFELYPETSKTPLQMNYSIEPLEINTSINNISKSFPLAPGSERSLHQRTYNSTPEHSPQLDYNSKNEIASSDSTLTSSNSDKDEILEGRDCNNIVNASITYQSPISNNVTNWSMDYSNRSYHDSLSDFELMSHFPKLQSLNPKAEAFSPSNNMYNFKPEDFYYNIHGTLTLNPTANIFRPRQGFPVPNLSSVDKNHVAYNPMTQTCPDNSSFVIAPPEERLIRLQDHINMAINILLRNNGFDHNLAEAAFTSFMRSANLDLNTRLTTTEFTSLINNIINQSNNPVQAPAQPTSMVPPPSMAALTNHTLNNYPLINDSNQSNYHRHQPLLIGQTAQTHWPMMPGLNSQSIWSPAVSNGILAPPQPLTPSSATLNPSFFPNLSQSISAAKAAFNSPLPSSPFTSTIHTPQLLSSLTTNDSSSYLSQTSQTSQIDNHSGNELPSVICVSATSPTM